MFLMLYLLGGSDQVNYLIWWQNAEKTGLIFSLERRFCHGNEPFKIFLADHNLPQTCDKRIITAKARAESGKNV